MIQLIYVICFYENCNFYLLGESINTIKYIFFLFVESNEICQEINTKKSKCTFMFSSSEYRAKLLQKIDNKLAENVENV